MLFKKLIEDVEIDSNVSNFLSKDIQDVKIDSRLINKGDVFVALSGENFDGNNFINEALNKGASIVVTDKENIGENIVKVKNARKAYSLMCKNFFGRYCDELKLIAVTGTNGKTTTCNIIKQLMQQAGAKVGVIGTLGAGFDDKINDTGFTTPDPYLLHKLFRDMKINGCEFVVMEASAHALYLDKLEGVSFEIGVLTNITQDHLDFFGDMENYAQAKFKLFEPLKVKLGIICIDDKYCQNLFSNPKVPMISYSLNHQADIMASEIKNSFDNSSFKCSYMGESVNFKSKLVGEYNIKNILAGISVCRALGVPMSMLRFSLNYVEPAEGRFNIIKMGNTNVIVDFAHTPDGLENVLKTIRKMSDSKVIVIFGCGGNRDKGKRPLMGKIADQYADEIILTSDNPRFENPYEIIDDIKNGVKDKKPIIIENRKKAIEYALENFNNKETVVIAGKGGEKYQDVDGVKQPYNDFDVVYNFYRKHFKEIDNE